MKKRIYTYITLATSLLLTAFIPYSAHAARIHTQQPHHQMQQYHQVSGNTSGYGFTSYPKALDHVIQKLQSLPEGKKLIEDVLAEGSVSIEFRRGLSFAAFWETGNRVVIIDPDQSRTEGTRLTSLVFELFNATHDKRFQEHIEGALNGTLNKQQYVEGLERMEHLTGLKTAALLEKGVQQGLFPHDAYQPIFQNFDDHYRMQQHTGHSQWIANSYENMMRDQPIRIAGGGRYHAS